MQKPPVPAKPPIPAKPRNVQKTNYVVIPSQQHQHSYSEQHNFRNILTPTRQPLRNVDEQQIFSSSLPSSTTYQYFSTAAAGECTRNGNAQYTNGTTSSSSSMEMQINDNNGKYHQHHRTSDNKNFNHTPSHSFDSSGSSSSGGFREIDYNVSKTKALYEIHDNSNSNDHETPPASYPITTTNIGHSKIQEIQSKLLLQQQQQQQSIQNHQHSEQIAINRAQYQKSTQELEKLFGMRVAASEKEIRHHQPPKLSMSINQEKPAVMRKKSSISGDDEVDLCNSLKSQLTLNISKQIQQKLQAEMKQQCEIIKEKYLIEKVPVQIHYSDYVVILY